MPPASVPGPGAEKLQLRKNFEKKTPIKPTWRHADVVYEDAGGTHGGKGGKAKGNKGKAKGGNGKEETKRFSYGAFNFNVNDNGGGSKLTGVTAGGSSSSSSSSSSSAST